MNAIETYEHRLIFSFPEFHVSRIFTMSLKIIFALTLQMKLNKFLSCFLLASNVLSKARFPSFVRTFLPVSDEDEETKRVVRSSKDKR